jgi:hypothetical protein
LTAAAVSTSVAGARGAPSAVAASLLTGARSAGRADVAEPKVSIVMMFSFTKNPRLKKNSRGT